MLPLDNYHLVSHFLVNYERRFGHPELLIQQAERDNVFRLQNMCRMGCPN